MVDEKMESLDDLRKLMSRDEDATRTLLKEVADALMSADATSECGTALGVRSDARVSRRNGYRERSWDTRARAIALAIPKQRQAP